MANGKTFSATKFKTGHYPAISDALLATASS
jgi:hypothetical protein